MEVFLNPYKWSNINGLIIGEYDPGLYKWPYINFRGKKSNHPKRTIRLFLKATHLAEFHQIEGFVADRRASKNV